jgi:outer membrane biosynthesis protein TonB
MGRLSALLLALLLGGASAVALASCGGGSDAKLLPGTTAEQIESNLDQVEQLAAEEDCIGAEDAVAEVAAEVEELNVAAKLKAALQEGTAKLSEVVGRCEEEATTEETEPAPETTVEEEVEPEKKPKKEKPDKQDEEPAEPKEEAPEAEETPPSNGKGEEKGQGEPPVQPEAEEVSPESGGVGPSVGVEK